MSGLAKMRGLCLVLALCSAITYGQQGTISVDSKVDKSTIRIGDLVTYSVIVTRSPGVQLIKPELAENLGAFEIRDYEVHEPKQQDGEIVEQVDYIISTFDVGEFEIPPLTFRYTVGDDSTQHELKTQPLNIVVESLKPSEAGDIRDIKNPLNLPRDYRHLILWGSIILATLILAGIAFYIWYRKRTGQGLLPQRVEPPRPAHEIALEKLEALKSSSLLQEERVKEFYIELSEIIRHYVEGRYFIIALELTTPELIENLERANVASEHVQLIEDFLQQCDLVKFAKYRPGDEEIAQDIATGYRIVEATRLIYDETEPESEEAESVEASVSDALTEKKAEDA